MEDRGVVAAIAAGDPGGLEQAYDRYAAPLYSYCCSVLRDPAGAADAVQDTFLIATARVRRLRDRAAFRPWLYAVARNECMRRLRAAAATAGPKGAIPVPAGDEHGTGPGRAGPQALLRAAVDGLSAGQRDVILLSLGHDLSGDQLADVLGVSPNRAQAQVACARQQLEQALDALIATRSGPSARTELIAGLFAGITPPAALPVEFRTRSLYVIADRSPAGLAHRFTVADRAGPFGPSGFPQAAQPPLPAPWHQGWRNGRWWHRELWHRALRHRQAVAAHARAVVAGAAAAVTVAGVVAAVVIGGHHDPPATAHTGRPAHGAAGGTSQSTPG
jgi:DNA-directed RNA polymerase specialized sigma24 family protein